MAAAAVGVRGSPAWNGDAPWANGGGVQQQGLGSSPTTTNGRGSGTPGRGAFMNPSLGGGVVSRNGAHPGPFHEPNGGFAPGDDSVLLAQLAEASNSASVGPYLDHALRHIRRLKVELADSERRYRQAMTVCEQINQTLAMRERELAHLKQQHDILEQRERDENALQEDQAQVVRHLQAKLQTAEEELAEAEDARVEAEQSLEELRRHFLRLSGRGAHHLARLAGQNRDGRSDSSEGDRDGARAGRSEDDADDPIDCLATAYQEQSSDMERAATRLNEETGHLARAMEHIATRITEAVATCAVSANVPLNKFRTALHDLREATTATMHAADRTWEPGVDGTDKLSDNARGGGSDDDSSASGGASISEAQLWQRRTTHMMQGLDRIASVAQHMQALEEYVWLAANEIRSVSREHALEADETEAKAELEAAQRARESARDLDSEDRVLRLAAEEQCRNAQKQLREREAFHEERYNELLERFKELQSKAAEQRYQQQETKVGDVMRLRERVVQQAAMIQQLRDRINRASRPEGRSNEARTRTPAPTAFDTTREGRSERADLEQDESPPRSVTPLEHSAQAVEDTLRKYGLDNGGDTSPRANRRREPAAPTPAETSRADSRRKRGSAVGVDQDKAEVRRAWSQAPVTAGKDIATSDSAARRPRRRAAREPLPNELRERRKEWRSKGMLKVNFTASPGASQRYMSLSDSESDPPRHSKPRYRLHDPEAQKRREQKARMELQQQLRESRLAERDPNNVRHAAVWKEAIKQEAEETRQAKAESLTPKDLSAVRRERTVNSYAGKYAFLPAASRPIGLSPERATGGDGSASRGEHRGSTTPAKARHSTPIETQRVRARLETPPSTVRRGERRRMASAKKAERPHRQLNDTIDSGNESDWEYDDVRQSGGGRRGHHHHHPRRAYYDDDGGDDHDYDKNMAGPREKAVRGGSRRARSAGHSESGAADRRSSTPASKTSKAGEARRAASVGTRKRKSATTKKKSSKKAAGTSSKNAGRRTTTSKGKTKSAASGATKRTPRGRSPARRKKRADGGGASRSASSRPRRSADPHYLDRTSADGSPCRYHDHFMTHKRGGSRHPSQATQWSAARATRQRVRSPPRRVTGGTPVLYTQERHFAIGAVNDSSKHGRAYVVLRES